MWKTVLAGASALAIAGSAIGYAHPGEGRGSRAHGWHPTAQDIAAFGDARIAALKAGLELTPEQEKNWPAVESALRGIAKQRADRFAARRDAKAPADPVGRLDRRAEAMQNRGAALRKFADAAGPLYASLNDAQKHRFTVLARFDLRPFGKGHHGWRGRDGHGRSGWRHDRGPEGTRIGVPERGPGPQ